MSTGSGIPDYRDADGAWKRGPRPVTYQEFIASAATRRRYWARSLVGWARIQRAAPNAAHRALSRLEQRGRVRLIVTQNVDRLHQAAGSRNVLDLHGRLDRVRCLRCERRTPRAAFQAALERRNPAWAVLDAVSAPDGDADLGGLDFSRFDVPVCPSCGGVLKPDVVFFGETVPRERVAFAMAAAREADAMLVVGSSLSVLSGYRFAREMARLRKPIAAVNLGAMRADDLLELKVAQNCCRALEFLLDSACASARAAAGTGPVPAAATAADAAALRPANQARAEQPQARTGGR